MNRLYTTALAALVGLAGANAQNSAVTSTQAPERHLKGRLPSPAHHNAIPGISGDREVIWTDDFSNEANWVIGHDGPENLDWQIGQNLFGSGEAAIDTILSTTQSNGYAMLDSDGYGNNGTTYEQSHMTMANPVDLTDYPQVVVEFETQYYKWTDEECYLVVSTDGNFPVIAETELTTNPNVFRVWPDMVTQADVANPTLKRINISSVAGGQSQVWVRFHWVGIFGYQWYVDDMTISTPPDNDLMIEDSWLVADAANYEDSTVRNLEYSWLPIEENIAMVLSTAIYNNGGVAQNNVVVTATVNGTPYTSAPMTLPPFVGDTIQITTGFTPSTPGEVEVTFSIASDDPNDANLDDNTDAGSFMVSGPGSADGNSVMALDANSLDGRYRVCDVCAFDAVATRFQIEGETSMAYGVGVAIYGPQTTPGSLMSVFLLDVNGEVASVQDFEVLTSYTSDIGEATIVNIPFDAPVELDPGVDYQLWFENLSEDTVSIGTSGAVNPGGLLGHVPDDAQNTIYIGWGNGAIMGRLYLENAVSWVGVEDKTTLDGVSLYPNPTNGLVRLDITEPGSYQVDVFNVMGELVSTQRTNNSITMDLSGMATGVYTVRVYNQEKSMVQRVTLN